MKNKILDFQVRPPITVYKTLFDVHLKRMARVSQY